MYLCKTLMNTERTDQGKLLHLNALAYSGLCLRNSVSLYNRVHIDKSKLDCLKYECEQHFNCQSNNIDHRESYSSLHHEDTSRLGIWPWFKQHTRKGSQTLQTCILCQEHNQGKAFTLEASLQA